MLTTEYEKKLFMRCTGYYFFGLDVGCNCYRCGEFAEHGTVFASFTRNIQLNDEHLMLDFQPYFFQFNKSGIMNSCTKQASTVSGHYQSNAGLVLTSNESISGDLHLLKNYSTERNTKRKFKEEA